MVNILKLKGKIVECGTNIEELSKNIGINKSTFYRKLNSNGEEFSVREVTFMIRTLNLSLNEVNEIFFSQFVA